MFGCKTETKLLMLSNLVHDKEALLAVCDVMPESVGRKSVFEREHGWSGLGWSSGQYFYSFIVNPKIWQQLNSAQGNYILSTRQLLTGKIFFTKFAQRLSAAQACASRLIKR